jgi:hypothetical protein
VANVQNRSEFDAHSGDDCDTRERYHREVKRFLADVIRIGGGPRQLARALTGLGFTYSEGAVRAWRGERNPPADVIFALARHYEVSLNDYAFASTIQERLEALEEKVAALQAGAA